MELIKIGIYGNGAEIAIGSLKNKEAIDLKKLAHLDGLDEDSITAITGREWNEIDNIWHYYGPAEGFELREQNNNKVNLINSESWYFSEIDEGNNRDLLEKFTNKPVKNFWDARKEIKNRYCLISISREKGYWGSFYLPNDFKSELLTVYTCSNEFRDEFPHVLGFSYDGKILEWEKNEDTYGSYKSHILFDLKDEKTLIEI